jgi:hypothetical protein
MTTATWSPTWRTLPSGDSGMGCGGSIIGEPSLRLLISQPQGRLPTPAWPVRAGEDGDHARHGQRGGLVDRLDHRVRVGRAHDQACSWPGRLMSSV